MKYRLKIIQIHTPVQEVAVMYQDVITTTLKESKEEERRDIDRLTSDIILYLHLYPLNEWREESCEHVRKVGISAGEKGN